MEDLQAQIKEEFSKLKSTGLSNIYHCLGRIIGRHLSGDVVVVEVAVGNRPISSIAVGIGKDRTRIIGIDPDLVMPPGIEYRRGIAQKLPLDPKEANLILFNDALRYVLSQDSRVESFDPKRMYESNETTITGVCSELLRVMPNFIIFRDPVPSPVFQKNYKKPEEWYELILESVTPQYANMGFGELMKKLYNGKPLETWLFLSQDLNYSRTLWSKI